EKVHAANIKRLQIFVNNGSKYPGANRLVKVSDGKSYRIDLLSTENKQLEIGDKVYRHLVDGDMVLFNRQPSLESTSICMMYVKVDLGKTAVLKINTGATPAFNADFDG